MTKIPRLGAESIVLGDYCKDCIRAVPCGSGLVFCVILQGVVKQADAACKKFEGKE